MENIEEQNFTDVPVNEIPKLTDNPNTRTYRGDLDQITIDNRVYQTYDDDEDDAQEKSSMPYKLTLVGSGASLIVIIGALISGAFGVSESVTSQVASAGSQALVGTISGGFALSQSGNKGKIKRKKPPQQKEGS